MPMLNIHSRMGVFIPRVSLSSSGRKSARGKSKPDRDILSKMESRWKVVGMGIQGYQPVPCGHPHAPHGKKAGGGHGIDCVLLREGLVMNAHRTWEIPPVKDEGRGTVFVE
jgi:hypothetical protein